MWMQIKGGGDVCGPLSLWWERNGWPLGGRTKEEGNDVKCHSDWTFACDFSEYLPDTSLAFAVRTIAPSPHSSVRALLIPKSLWDHSLLFWVCQSYHNKISPQSNFRHFSRPKSPSAIHLHFIPDLRQPPVTLCLCSFSFNRNFIWIKFIWIKLHEYNM